MTKRFFVVVLVLSLAGNLLADVKLPAIVSDNMVLQQKSNARVWGWAEPGEKVKVKGSWAKKFSKPVTAGKNGKWKISIKTPKAGGPYTVTVKGNNTISLKNILIGEVWVCSGQSNMEYRLAHANNGKPEAVEANYPEIRLFNVGGAYSAHPADDVKGQWSECNPRSAGGFSAVAYYFGKKIHKKLNVPIGLISTAMGATPARAWTSGKMLLAKNMYAHEVKMISGKNPARVHARYPSALFNGMISPLTSSTIKGAIWYQGENDVSGVIWYRPLFPNLIQSWRDAWGLGDFPFYHVQLPPYDYGSSNSAFLREVQMKTLSMKNVGIAVTLDVGDFKNIHPGNKKDVGERLALWALAKDYGQKDLVCSGPIYKSMKIEGGKIRLSFDYTGSGMVAKDGTLANFVIAGADKKFVPAKATIKNNTIVVSSDKVTRPVAVRYAFNNAGVPSLFNKEGLPASSFRTDNW
jgi:sialate O-acetylesterase